MLEIAVEKNYCIPTSITLVGTYIIILLLYSKLLVI